MPVELCMYRARVGCYYIIAFIKTKHLSFLNKSLMVQFFIMAFIKYPQSITLSLFVHFLVAETKVHYFCDALIYEKQLLKGNNVRTEIATSIYIAAINRYLLLLSGDIETNPGPPSLTDLLVMHININSIRNKIDLMEAEYGHFDVITVSETWLSDSISNDSIHMTNFHPPIRLDRPNDAHGGVAIYIKNNLFVNLVLTFM